MSERKLFCYGYRRVSSERQAREGISLDEQQRQIEAAYAYEAKRTHAWAGMFTDDGVTGKIPIRHRPAGADLFARLEKGDCLIFAKLDRAFRSLRDMVETVELLQARQVRMIFLDLRADTASASGRMMLQILAVFAEFERSRLIERCREAKGALKAQGAYLGGDPPFGFKVVRSTTGKGRVLVLYPEERIIAGKIVAWKDAGQSYYQIAAHLLSHRVRTKDGQEYSPKTVERHYKHEKRLRRQEAEAAARTEEVLKDGQDGTPPV